MGIKIYPKSALEAKIREFGEEIGIVFPPLGNHSANAKYSYEANILHELGHWAVVPDFMVKYCEMGLGYGDEPIDMSKPGMIPGHSSFVFHFIRTKLRDLLPLGKIKETKARFDDLQHIEYFNANGQRQRSSSSSYLDFFSKLPIPDEWGVQEWCYQVAQNKGWTECAGRSWMGSSSQYHLSFRDVFQDTSNESQLSRVGIDVEKGVFRPTVTRVDFKNDSWRLFAKKKLLCKVPVFPRCEILAYVFGDGTLQPGIKNPG